MSFIKTNWQIITLVILGSVFFIAYSWFPYQTTKNGDVKFASPDGTANYFWAERYATGEELFYFEPLNLIAKDVVATRSVRSDDGVVKPVSFLGIILIYGLIGKIFGSWIIIYLTPLFAVLGVLFFYGIIKHAFNKKTAFISALMLLCLAPYWYYTSRSMFHNVLFVDLLLAGVFILLYKPKKDVAAPRLYEIFAGIFIGLAIITRTSELIWLAPAALIVWIFYFKNIKWDKLILFLCGVFLALMPMLYYNQVLYGGFLKFGYNKPTVVEVQTLSAPLLVKEEREISYLSILREKINGFLPAQIDIKQAGKSFIYYYVIMFWYLFWPALFGGAWLLYNWKKIDKKQKIYFIIFITSSIILGLYYGSWKIYDNPNKSSVTIGNSYTRYWLPIYIMSIPLAIVFFMKLSEIIKRKYLICILWIVIITAFFILNFQTAVLAKEEGLNTMRKSLATDINLVNSILPYVKPGAVIISERFDKIFCSEYKVISGNFTDKEHNLEYKKLVEYGTPLYYYGFIFPEVDIDYLNNRRLKDFNLQIKTVKLDEASRLGLYKIVESP